MPMVISLAACHADAAPAGGRSFAAELIEHVATAVIGRQAAVIDTGTVRMFGRVLPPYAAVRSPPPTGTG
jgi:hypothetical protein